MEKIEEDSSNPDEIIDGIYVEDYAILEKRSGEVLYVETNDNEGINDTENATVITKDGIAQKSGGCFIDKKGKVYTWGSNYYGQLGDGTTETRDIPICISEIEGSDLKGKKITNLDYCTRGGYTFALDVDGYIYMEKRNDSYICKSSKLKADFVDIC